MVELCEDFDLSSGPSFHVFTVKSSFEAFLRTQRCPLPQPEQFLAQASFVYPISKRNKHMWAMWITPGLELDQGVIEAVLTTIEKERKLQRVVTIVHWFQIADLELRTLTQLYQVILHQRRATPVRVFPRSDERLKQLIDSLQVPNLPELDWQQFGDPEEYARGGNGIIQLRRHKLTNEPLIFKLINRTQYSEEQMKYLTRETEITKKFCGWKYDRIFVKQLYESFVDSADWLVIPLEYCAGGNLCKYLPNLENGTHLSMDAIRRIIYQVATALRYMHSKNIVHRDLKAENVLLTSEILEKSDVKICDFGLSKELVPGNLDTDIFDKKKFPPEVEKGVCSCKVDVWYLGLLTDELVYGRTNYIQVYSSKEEVPARRTLRKETWDLPPDDVNEFIFRLRQTQETRPNIHQVLEAPFLLAYKDRILRNLDGRLRKCGKEFERNKVLAEHEGAGANDWIRETQDTILKCRAELEDLEIYDWTEVPALLDQVHTLFGSNESLLSE